MEIGKYTYGKPTILWGNPRAKLIVGKFCSLANTTKVYLGGNHRVDWITTYPFGHINKSIFPYDGKNHPSTNGSVIIGNDVWIADNVTIMSGVRIGDGAVIANNSHVVKDVEPYTLVGGNPAKFIKYRFKQEEIEQLLKIKWWDWDIEKIKENIPLLCSADISTFIAKAQECTK